MSGLVRHEAFDFSRYQPGDVVVISELDVARHLGPAGMGRLWGEVQRAAEREGLQWRIERDIEHMNVRISFD